MLLFKKILNFKKEGGLSDKRGATRYPAGAKFPLKAKVTLIGRDGEGHVLKSNDARAMDWGGQIVNMSTTGISLRLHPAAMGASGENCRLKLELDHMLFEIEGAIAHFWSGPQYATVGIAAKFPDAHTQKAFRQLLEPVAIGAGLSPVTGVKQDVEGLMKEQYSGEDETLLSIWRDPTGKVIQYFELVTHGYYIRGSAQAPGLQIGTQADPTIKPTSPQIAELRQFFRLIVPNIAKTVPADARFFLERFVQ